MKIKINDLYKTNNKWYYNYLMSIQCKEITNLIKAAIPDATIEIKDLMGDNNHYHLK